MPKSSSPLSRRQAQSRSRDIGQGAAKPDGYVILGIYAAGMTSARPLSVRGRLVLFDTVAMAQQFVPLLGMGRETQWTNKGESVYWLPLDPRGINRADILTGYDPYNVPACFPGQIRSEAKSKEWKYHVMWNHAFFDCGQMQVQADGAIINAALPMAPPAPEQRRLIVARTVPMGARM